jgi:uncharacterized protein (TIGR02145 family)
MEEIKIGSQIWMKRNLDVSVFQNGDEIPEIKSDEKWNDASPILVGEKIAACCYYNNSSNENLKYGKLYNWQAVIDERGLAPKGWRIATGQDWVQLFEFLGENIHSAIKDQNDWNRNVGCIDRFLVRFTKIKIPDYPLLNESGLTILPGGLRTEVGSFGGVKDYANFWCASLNKWTDEPYDLIINPYAYNFSSSYRRGEGRSIRCVKIE